MHETREAEIMRKSKWGSRDGARGAVAELQYRVIIGQNRKRGGGADEARSK